MTTSKESGESFKPTPYAVNCRIHGLVYLTEDMYTTQLEHGDDSWRCPRMSDDLNNLGLCWRRSEWDDDTYEKYLEEQDKIDNSNSIGDLI